MAEKKEHCPDCGGTGFLIDYTAACCRNPNEDGSCCNSPIAEPIQSGCSRCGATGFTSPSKVVPEPMEVEGVENMANALDCIYSALMYAGRYVDENKLFDGLYMKATPTLYDADETIENLVKVYSELIGKYMKGSPADVYVENLRQCKLVKVKFTINKL
jgi:hypothetical protein